MSAVTRFFDNPYMVFRQPAVQRRMRWMSDEPYLKRVYRARTGRKLDLDHPQRFNEKMQWLKLHDRNPRYGALVDKCAVKKLMAELIGADHVVETYQVWDRVEDLDVALLPNRFVLKTNHDSGGVVICADKESFDLEAARKELQKSFGTNYFWRTREWPYKQVTPKVFAERYLTGEGDDGIVDYKVLCFSNGRMITLVCEGRLGPLGMKKTYFDEEWRPLDLCEGGCPSNPHRSRPEHFDQMKEMAQRIAKGMPFCRVDFFESGGVCYFGEITFYPKSGFELFAPDDWDVTFGSWIDLSLAYGNGFEES